MALITTTNWAATAAVAVVVLFLTVAVAAPVADAQQQTSTECAATITSVYTQCFLADPTAKPTDECCATFKAAATTELPCVCSYYFSATSLSNISGSFFTDVATNCGISGSLSACSGNGKGGGNGIGGAIKAGAADKVSSKGFIGLLGTLFLMVFN